MTLRLVPVVGALPDAIAALQTEADAETIENVSRLIEDWSSGAERFAKPGELLLAAYEDDLLVGIGGLTAEPDARLDAMRLRRLFVLKRHRRHGIGRVLAATLMDRGLGHAALLTLNAGVPGAAGFWEALGFRGVDAENHTHEFRAADHAA